MNVSLWQGSWEQWQKCEDKDELLQADTLTLLDLYLFERLRWGEQSAIIKYRYELPDAEVSCQEEIFLTVSMKPPVRSANCWRRLQES